jgi:acyl-CoA synthetase (NDP forming)
MSAARAAARNKPVIVVKAGRSAAGQQAAASHTGALAGSDAVFDAAIARAGMLRVGTLQDLFLAAETLARFRDGPSGQLVVLTNGGGAGVMAADAATAEGVPLAPLDAATIERLNAVLPANWSHANPVDIIGDAPAPRYVDALEALSQDRESAMLFIHAPTAIVPSAEIAQALLPQVTQAAPPRAGLLAGRHRGGRGASALPQRRRARLRHARRGGARLRLPAHLPPAPGGAAADPTCPRRRSRGDLPRIRRIVDHVLSAADANC